MINTNKRVLNIISRLRYIGNKHHTLHEIKHKDNAYSKLHEQWESPYKLSVKTNERRLGKLEQSHFGTAMLKIMDDVTLHDIKDAASNKYHQQRQKPQTGSMKTHQRRLARLKVAHFGTTYNFLKTLFGKITNLSR